MITEEVALSELGACLFNDIKYIGSSVSHQWGSVNVLWVNKRVFWQDLGLPQTIMAFFLFFGTLFCNTFLDHFLGEGIFAKCLEARLHYVPYGSPYNLDCCI